jgi:predicted TIM-barrel fold metal-dependent hydrolase
MTYRAIDIHTHRLSGERRPTQQNLADAGSLFKSGLWDVDPIEYYAERHMMAVVFDVDSEATSGERISNDEVMDLAKRSAGRLVAFASVDPWKGRAAIRELERCCELGMRGLKLMPITQAFALNDRQFYPLWDACQSLGMPLMVHTGNTAIGSGAPGGRGLKLRYGMPVPSIDDVAADFPRLTIIAAHFAWPWHLDLLAVARHKGNVYVDLSGWAPKYIPPEVVKDMNSVIPHKFLFGTDFPLMNPDRWMEDFQNLDLKPEVRPKILYENASRILGLDAADFSLETAKGE